MLFSTPEDLLDPEIEPASFVSPAFAGRFFTTVPPRKPLFTATEFQTVLPLLDSASPHLLSTSDRMMFPQNKSYYIIVLT